MLLRHALFAVALIGGFSGISRADDFLLQLEEVRDDGDTAVAEGKGRVVRSLEADGSLDRPFYIRSVIGNEQWLLQGEIKEKPDGRFEVSYVFTSTELREDPASRIRFEGDFVTRLRRGKILGRAPGRGGAEFKLTLYPFIPEFGFRGLWSSFSVRLVDGSGRPVADAKAALYGPFGDSDWMLIVGPSKSDSKGVVRMGEGRESLAEWTFVAEHPQRGLVAAVNLNRNNASHYRGAKPRTITMRKELKRWKRPTKDKDAEQ